MREKRGLCYAVRRFSGEAHTVKKFLFAILAAASVAATAPALADGHGEKVRAELMRLAVGDHRADAHVARNRYRHPVETLAFFGIEPGMTVVEVSPGGSGWYTEILAPFLRDDGMLYAASYDPESTSEYSQRNAKKYGDKLASRGDLYGKVNLTVFAPPAKLDIAPADSADLVLTFRNTHGWARRDQADDVFAAFYRVLRSGGVLGVVQHRAGLEGEADPAMGYLTEEQVIDFATGAGFRLVDRSDINANPLDTRDHPEGVWTLPPALRLDDVDREKYLAIGESDRMTLKFVKD